MCGSDRTGSSEDSDGDEEDESSMMNWVIPPAHPPQARGLPQNNQSSGSDAIFYVFYDN
jgi:hypothetical protein